ncbi:MAG: DUF2442 domain-containing protein [Myxococcota bacterium]
MFVHVVQAQHLGGHRVRLRFDDGREGEVDLLDELHGPVFEPLRDVEAFGAFRIDGGTLAWPNGADFAPEFLHARVGATRAA